MTTTAHQLHFTALLHDYASYNRWANQRLIDWLRTKPADIIDREIASSFPSIKATLFHIWNVQKMWLSSLQGEKSKPAYGQVFEGTNEDLFNKLTSQSEALYEHIRSLKAEQLAEDCAFLVPVRWPEWDEFSKPRAEVILHTMNHSTYHRGQIVTIGRQAGLTDAPMTDYMFYLIMAKTPAGMADAMLSL